MNALGRQDRRATIRRVPAACGPRARGPGRRPPAGRRAGPIGAVFGPFSGRERMLPYAGRCSCRATTASTSAPDAARPRRRDRGARRPAHDRLHLPHRAAPRQRRPLRHRRRPLEHLVRGLGVARARHRSRPACSTRTSSYPHRDTLAYSENNIVAGVLGLPAYLLTGNPYATHNLSMLARHRAGVRRRLRAGPLPDAATPASSIVAAIGFAFCPFLFARTAHIQLMLFFGAADRDAGDAPPGRRAVGRARRRPRPGARGAGAGLRLLRHLRRRCWPRSACRSSRVTRGRWRSARYWLCGASRRPRSIGLVVPFFLPYVRVQGELGLHPLGRGGRATTRPTSRPGWPRARGRTAGSCRGSATGTRCSSRRADAGRRRVGRGSRGVAAAGGHAGGRRSRPTPGAATRRRWRSTASAALLAFWISFGPAAGLYRVLFAVIPVFSFLRAPSRIGIVVVLALAVLPRVRAWPWSSRRLDAAGADVGRRGAVAGRCRAELFTAPIAVRDAPPVASAYRHLATLRRAAVLELPFFYERSDFPRHAALHVGLGLALAAADQRLQRSHPARVPRPGAADARLPVDGVVRRAAPAPCPLRRHAPEPVRAPRSRAHAGTPEGLRRIL